MKFSVLLSIYHKEKPDYFDRCMQSIWEKQSVQPNEVVLVEDGPLTEPLYHMIDKWKKILDKSLVVIVLKENVGLGKALNIGLQQCRYELVARMDTDDISLPDRFATQLEIFKMHNIDICSAWVGEFHDSQSNIVSYRKVPKTHEEIICFAKKRNPMNHPAVMYKKSKVLEAGGYKTMTGFEDYYLWARMILSGAKFYNIQKPLVNMQTGESQLQRRRGISYAKDEIRFQRRLVMLKFITYREFLSNISLRFIARTVPSSITKFIYSYLRR